MTTRPRSPSALVEDTIQKCRNTSASSSYSKQVCVVLSQNEEIPDGVKVFFYLFILDPDKKDDDSLSLHPRNWIVKFAGNYPFDMALLVVDSTLYMFGDFYPRIGWQLPSYSFDLSPHLCADTTSYGHVPHTLDFDCKLKSGMRTLPTMTSNIVMPRAVFVAGKICVFSSYTDDGILTFELYDLASGQWLMVPELRVGPPDGIGEVTFYAVEDNWLYICTTTVGPFRMDCDRCERQWEETQVLLPYCDGWYGILGVMVKNGSMLLSPAFTAYDMDTPTKAHQDFKLFEDSSIGNFYPGGSSILLFPKEEDKDGLLWACIVEIGLKQDELVMGGRDAPVLRVSLIQFDDNDYTSLLNPTILHARLFDMDFDIQTFEITVVGLFQM